MKQAAKQRMGKIQNDIDTLDETYLTNEIKRGNKLLDIVSKMIDFLTNKEFSY
ncbi:hypothetical protein [Gottfriedia acidiceleris]|uniref:hypothetical protein n=1 Tax=Gottfriedia acidiceleris TaxID=371036 RepID=UPI002FFD97E9